MLGIYRSKLLKEDAMAWACHKAVTVGRQFFAQQSLEKAGRSGTPCSKDKFTRALPCGARRVDVGV